VPKLARTVVVRDSGNRAVVLRAGTDLPEWAAAQVTNPRAVAAEAPAGPVPAPVPPSGSGGTGSGPPAPPAGDDGFDPDAPIVEIMERVGTDRDLAGRYLQAESDKGEDARKTLVERLTAILTAQAG
jgi:hypothetical protein